MVIRRKPMRWKRKMLNVISRLQLFIQLKPLTRQTNLIKFIQSNKFDNSPSHT